MAQWARSNHKGPFKREAVGSSGRCDDGSRGGEGGVTMLAL